MPDRPKPLFYQTILSVRNAAPLQTGVLQTQKIRLKCFKSKEKLCAY